MFGARVKIYFSAGYKHLARNVQISRNNASASILYQRNLYFDNEENIKYPGANHAIRRDSKSFSIAAASILAKVKRDEIMKIEAKMNPQFGWERNKGYGTKEHIAAIKKHGYTNLHRKTFLKKILSFESQQELL